MQRISAKGKVVRLQIESRQGDVARLIEKDGRPLTSAENQAEIARLTRILAVPSEFLRHHKHDAAMLHDANTLLGELPKALLYTYTEGQPQRANLPGPQIVIDFRPNPAYKPPTMLSEVLTGISGRVWIDRKTHNMTRIEGSFHKAVNFGYGVVAHIYPGGTLALEQIDIGNGHWAFSHLDEHLLVRAFMVKMIPEDVTMTATDFHPLPGPIDFQDAVRQLLAVPVHTQ
ncbi:MAG: hypothetical protein ABI142_04610 [Bryocella sp.]